VRAHERDVVGFQQIENALAALGLVPAGVPKFHGKGNVSPAFGQALDALSVAFGSSKPGWKLKHERAQALLGEQRLEKAIEPLLEFLGDGFRQSVGVYP